MIVIQTYKINKETGGPKYKDYCATCGVGVEMAAIRHDRQNNDLNKYGPIEIYNIFDTGAILNRPAGVTVSATSGASGIAYWINAHYRLTGDEMITKKDPLVVKIKSWVDEQYAAGRQTVISTAELEKLIVTFRKEAE
jgi:hypothetical protein